MSLDQAEAFLEKVEDSEELQQQIEDADSDSVEDIYAAVAEIAKSNGFDCSGEDIEAALEDDEEIEASVSDSDEIDDDALEAVAGGAGKRRKKRRKSKWKSKFKKVYKKRRRRRRKSSSSSASSS